MKNNETFGEWVASIERGNCGFTYVRFYSDAPWVRNEAPHGNPQLIGVSLAQRSRNQTT
jgi:hypothetical protein